MPEWETLDCTRLYFYEREAHRAIVIAEAIDTPVQKEFNLFRLSPMTCGGLYWTRTSYPVDVNDVHTPIEKAEYHELR